jgi:hypothetical protein
MKKVKKSPSKKTSKASAKVASYPRTSKDAYVTQKMLYHVRDELMAHTEKKFHEVKSEFHGVKSEIHSLKASLSKLEKLVHNSALLAEEQNNRNKIVLDGLSHLFERQERIESKIDSQI